MKLYHGTNADFDSISLTIGLKYKDFGWGFYATPDRNTAVLPLVKKDGLPEKAREIQHLLMPEMMVQYDEKDAIGRRYRRQDAIGTPFCITVDNDTLSDNAVTVRDRDTMQQERVSIDQLLGYLKNNL